MKQALWSSACALAVLAGPSMTAAQSLPAWCGGKALGGSREDVRRVGSEDPEKAVDGIAKASCSTDADVEKARAEVDAARAKWSAELGMTEADWADAVAYQGDRSTDVKYVSNQLGSLSPLEQYRAIRKGLDLSGKEQADAFYAADALDGKLTEVGRLGFIQECFKKDLNHGSSLLWAACAPDIAQWSFEKFAAELRSDTTQAPALRMVVRLRAYATKQKIKAWTAQRDQLFAKDATYKKMFESAAEAREAWKKGPGSNGPLLELVLAMDSATASGSRKQLADCETTTKKALADAVATLPAKAFAGMVDVREEPERGFAYKAGRVLVNAPAVNLAANAYAQCFKEKSGASTWLASELLDVPGWRGPRLAAVVAVLSTKLEFDDMRAGTPSRPDLTARPFRAYTGNSRSVGGAVDKVTPEKDKLVVKLKKTSAKRVDCVKAHTTNRLSRIRSNGTLEYEEICDKTAVVTYDTTWVGDFNLSTAFGPPLKPGFVFSSVYPPTGTDKLADIVAVWPSTSATEPSHVLGAKLK